jgi:thiosulfate/3-mercaptopyruvate sulfurtransferase
MAAAAAIVLVTAPAPVTHAPAGRQSVLISANSLAALIAREPAAGRADSPLVILRVVQTGAADTARIPGSRDLAFDALVVERDGLPNELAPVTALDSVLESVGVGDRSRIVLYGEPLEAARAFFTLDALGHGEHAAVLDGGIAAWRAAGGALAAGPQRVAARGRLTSRPDAGRVVDAAWVAARSDSPHIALIDARPPEEYRGDRPGAGVTRPGHIPGAGSLFWKTTLVSDSLPRLKDADSLRALFAAAGVKAGDTVVTYCRTGVQASHAYLVARYLGFPVRMYDGSFIDWSRRPTLPVTKGASPR